MSNKFSDEADNTRAFGSDNRTPEAVCDKVRMILSDICGKDASTMNRGTRILQDLGLDSLEVYELVIDLEETYAIRLPDEELERLQTIGDIADKIYEHIPQGE